MHPLWAPIASTCDVEKFEDQRFSRDLGVGPLVQLASLRDL